MIRKTHGYTNLISSRNKRRIPTARILSSQIDHAATRNPTEYIIVFAVIRMRSSTRSPTRSTMDDSRCQWLGTRTKTASRKNDTIASISQFNNSWYKGDAGEKGDVIPTGRIDPDKPTQRPAWELQDKYTKSRNPAHDSKRYTYVDDCTDEIRRDVVLRFSVPPHMPRSGGQYSVLPELKVRQQSAAIRGQSTLPFAGRSALVRGNTNAATGSCAAAWKDSPPKSPATGGDRFDC